jgi:hypothetical protein
MLRNLISFFVFTFCLAIPPVVLLYTGSSKWVLPQFWAIFVLITALTLMLIVAVSLIQKRHPEMYAQTFLIMTVAKMVFSMALALFFAVKFKVDSVIFVLNFFYVYFLNTIFEVLVLLRNLRNQI